MEAITVEYLRSIGPDQLKKEMETPGRSEEIRQFLINRPSVLQNLSSEETEIVTEAIDPVVETQVEESIVTSEEQAEAERAAAILAQAESIRQSEEQAKQDSLRAAGITIQKDANGNIIKIVKEYQATDDAGNPIGRPTHLEAKSWEELSIKQQEAHVHATRAFQRLKAQKTTFKQTQTALPEVLSSEEATKLALDLKSDDPEKIEIAQRKLQADEILRRERDALIREENTRQTAVSYEFMTRHIEDYNRCEANGKAMAGYLKDNDLDWTVDNLELAFAALESQLAPKAAVATVQEPVDNTPDPVQQVAQAAPTAAVIQPAPAAVALAAPTAPVAAANPPAPTARPGVNSGLIPGQQQGQRPVGLKPQGLTMKEIFGWTGEQLRKERANPARRAEIDRTISAYNKARAATRV